MKALLLAAGFGTRLRPLTKTLPKCLVPIHGRPLLGIWLQRLAAAGVDDVIVNTHYLSDQVEAYLDGRPDQVKIIYEPELLGTGGTILSARDLLENSPFLVIHADNLSGIDIGALMRAHDTRPDQTCMTMALFETDSPESCGIVLTDKEGIVTDFYEKHSSPPGNLANAAVYVFEPEMIKNCEFLGKKAVDLSTEVIPNLIGSIYTYKMNEYHRDIGSMDALNLAHQEVGVADIDNWSV